ncbi:MAG: SO_0444 family Cu/Zn efflux transporter [Campylobacteraceae bacterium]|nr:SO_0444 family Cu/Zn efflux transporter [Campylobacteraceae bacterium]
MIYIEHFFINFWQILNEVSLYIIIGMLIAGLMKKLLPDAFIKQQLGKDSKSTIFKTALIGVPLPLCSCSVIPFATALKKDGASKSALQTFLISAPISGVDSILVTQGVLGTFFAIYRVFTSFVIAITAGLLSAWLDKTPEEKPQPMKFSSQKPMNKNLLQTCQTPKKENFFLDIWNYAYHQIFKDIAKPLLVGLILATLVSTLIPTKLDNFITQNLFISYTVMIAIAMPLYVCATSSVPLGLSLLMAGFSVGSTFVFLSAGPATSIITMSVVKKILGKKGLAIYLGTIFTCSFIFGFILDCFFADLITIGTLKSHLEEPSLLSVISSFLLITLLYKSLKRAHKSSCNCH